MENEWEVHVQERVEPILLRAGFVLIGRTPEFLEYRSPILILKLFYDSRERSNNFFLGLENNLVLFDEDILFNVFGSLAKIDRVPVEIFAASLSSFFQKEGALLISGDQNGLQRVFDYQEERSTAYTNQLVEKQLISEADRYWEGGDYDKFINSMRQIDIDHLPVSYRSKLKIAMNKLK